MTLPNRPTNEPDLIEKLLKLGEKRGATEHAGIEEVGVDLVTLLQKLNIPQGVLAEGIGQIRGKIQQKLSQEPDPAVKEYYKETEALLQQILKDIGEKPPSIAAPVTPEQGEVQEFNEAYFNNPKPKDILNAVIPPTPAPTPTPAPEPPAPVPTPEPPQPPPAPTPPGPSPVPKPPEPTPSPEPATESKEAPSFSRYLHKILEDPTSTEAKNLLTKLKSDSGRLWIDKKKADGSTVRIWISLDLTPEEKAKPPPEFVEIVKAKLTPGSLRFRIDEGATSWRTEWERKKQTILPLVNKPEELAASPSLGIPDDRRQAFVELLATYLTKDGEEKNIWTHVRNAYWHTVGWKTQTDVQGKLDELNVKLPSYDTAKVRVWEKIENADRPRLMGEVFLRQAGKEPEKLTISEKKPNWYHIGPYWIREENLRISYKYNSDGTMVEPRHFELMAWQTQPDEPTKEAATPASPPPEPSKSKSSGPTSAPTGPSVTPPASPPSAGKKAGPDIEQLRREWFQQKNVIDCGPGIILNGLRAIDAEFIPKDVTQVRREVNELRRKHIRSYPPGKLTTYDACEMIERPTSGFYAQFSLMDIQRYMEEKANCTSWSYGVPSSIPLTTAKKNFEEDLRKRNYDLLWFWTSPPAHYWGIAPQSDGTYLRLDSLRSAPRTLTATEGNSLIQKTLADNSTCYQFVRKGRTKKAPSARP